MADRFCHRVSGCVGDTPHEPGDLVDASIPDVKVKEWLAAGIIEPAKGVASASDVPARKKTKNAPLSAESQGVKDDNDKHSADREAGSSADQLST